MVKTRFVYYADRCIACKACQTACKNKNRLTAGEFFRRVDTWEIKDNLGIRVLRYSGACNHCADPACVKNCPTGAMHLAEDGTVQHNAAECIACGQCAESCPYKAPYISEKLGTSRKCDLCADLRAKGESPACVSACLTGALDVETVPEDDVRYGTEGSLPGILPDPCVTHPSLRIVHTGKEEANR